MLPQVGLWGSYGRFMSLRHSTSTLQYECAYRLIMHLNRSIGPIDSGSPTKQLLDLLLFFFAVHPSLLGLARFFLCCEFPFFFPSTVHPLLHIRIYSRIFFSRIFPFFSLYGTAVAPYQNFFREFFFPFFSLCGTRVTL